MRRLYKKICGVPSYKPPFDCRRVAELCNSGSHPIVPAFVHGSIFATVFFWIASIIGASLENKTIRTSLRVWDMLQES